ncbi:MAG TPA: hypothetical protein VHO94_03530 [Oscillospiraceae bacterium]|nr:hypothetical protein [Oscillospiraceae bacterium]
MTTACAVWGIAKADFLERVRHSSFVAFCALAVFFTFWFVPRPTGFTALVIDPDVFLQGSDPSWVPMSAAMCGGMMLCLFGFVYILNSVQCDRKSGVLSLLRTSSTGRAAYLFGKLISDTLILLCLLAAIIAGTFLIMEIRFPGRFLSPWDFFSPFLGIVPGLVFVSAFALLMECAPLFRRKTGLSIALFFCLSATILILAAMNINPYRLISVFDFSGYRWMRDSISAAACSVTGQSLPKISVFTYSHVASTSLKTLAFHGLMPSVSYLIDKLALLIASALITFLASCLLPKTENVFSISKPSPVPPKAKISSHPAVPVYRFGLFCAELRKMLGPQPVFWWVCAAGLWIACLFSPMDTVRNTLFALVFAWLIPVFSRMGCMEHQSGMTAILRTVPNAMVRQAFACYQAGAVVSLTAALPALIRLLCLADGAGLLSALIFAMFVPSMALFLGEWSASNRAFEILLLILCFLALNIPALLIMNQFSISSGMRMIVTILLTVVLRFLSFFKRLTGQRAHV